MKDKKLTLMGISHIENEKRLCIEVGIEEDFYNKIHKILKEMGLSEKLYYEELIPLKERVGEIVHMYNDELSLDIVYTSKNIIIIVRGETPILAKFKKLILEFWDFNE
jgi:hypothetical protein